MAEKGQEHLRVRLGPKMLKKIDIARAQSGRTRSDEIEARLQESFVQSDMESVAEMAVVRVLELIEMARLRKLHA